MSEIDRKIDAKISEIKEIKERLKSAVPPGCTAPLMASIAMKTSTLRSLRYQRKKMFGR